MNRHLTALTAIAPFCRLIAVAAVVGGLLACSPPRNDDLTTEVPGYADLGQHVGRNRIGMSQDQWIEMKNGVGEWERTGLIFGYADDYSECIKAIDGLKAVNFNREYRCVPAN